MTTSLSKFWIAATVVGVIAGALSMGVTAASAGQCPSDKVTTDGQKPGAKAHKGVAEKLLGQIDLSKEKVAINGHNFRMRRLDIQPGGEVAWHDHADRPALIYVVSGTITEYSTACSVPIVHTTGDLSVETHLSHWWKNTSKDPAVLISADIAADPNDHNM